MVVEAWKDAVAGQLLEGSYLARANRNRSPGRQAQRLGGQPWTNLVDQSSPVYYCRSISSSQPTVEVLVTSMEAIGSYEKTLTQPMSYHDRLKWIATGHDIPGTDFQFSDSGIHAFNTKVAKCFHAGVQTTLVFQS